MRRMVALVAVLALGLAACGGDDKKDDGPTSIQSGTTAPSDATTVPTGEAAKLASLLFVASDFPSGWTAGAPDPDAEANEALRTCVGGSPRAANLAELPGQTFSQQGNQISSDASIARDDASYAKDVAAFRGPKLASCLKEQLNKEIAKDLAGRAASVEVTDLAVARHGDVAIGRRMTVTVAGATPAESLKLFADFVILGKARREVAATFLGIGAPIDDGLRILLVDRLGARLDAVT